MICFVFFDQYLTAISFLPFLSSIVKLSRYQLRIGVLFAFLKINIWEFFFVILSLLSFVTYWFILYFWWLDFLFLSFCFFVFFELFGCLFFEFDLVLCSLFWGMIAGAVDVYLAFVCVCAPWMCAHSMGWTGWDLVFSSPLSLHCIRLTPPMDGLGCCRSWSLLQSGACFATASLTDVTQRRRCSAQDLHHVHQHLARSSTCH